MNEQMNIGCKRGSKVTIRIRRCTVDKKNFIEARGGVGLVTTNILDRVYWWVCKFEEMGWNMFKKTLEIIVPCCIFFFWGGGGGGRSQTLLKNGIERYMLLRENQNVFGCRNSNFLIIHEDLFLEKCIFSTTT